MQARCVKSSDAEKESKDRRAPASVTTPFLFRINTPVLPFSQIAAMNTPVILETGRQVNMATNTIIRTAGNGTMEYVSLFSDGVSPSVHRHAPLPKPSDVRRTLFQTLRSASNRFRAPAGCRRYRMSRPAVVIAVPSRLRLQAFGAMGIQKKKAGRKKSLPSVRRILETYFFILLPMPAIPTRPMPRKSRLTGSGTETGT